MYCRENTKKQQLNPTSFSSLIKELGRKWKEMPFHVRADYEAKAQHENSLRADLLSSPLPTKSGNHATTKQAEAVKDKSFRKFLIRAKPKRALLNQQNFQNSCSWKSSGLGLADCNSALRQDLYDYTSPQSHPVVQLRDCLHSPLPALLPCHPPPSSCHDATCGVLHGQCVKLIRSPHAQSFIKRLVEYACNDKIYQGCCISFQVENNILRRVSTTVMLLIGAVYKKPASIVFVRLHSVPDSANYSIMGDYLEPKFVMGSKVLDDLLHDFKEVPTHLSFSLHK